MNVGQERQFGRLRFRDTEPGRAVFGSIEDGTLRSLSIGYSVERWEQIAEGDRTVRIARSWTPREVSIVAIPADAGAHFRSLNMDGPNMAENQTTTAPAVHTATDPVAAERERAATIMNHCRRHDLGDMGDDLIRSGASTDAARTAILDALADADARITPVAESAPHGVRHRGFEDPAFLAEAAGEASFARLNPRHEHSPAARAFAHRSLPEIAREVLEMRGVRTRGLSADHVITRSLGGAHTTSDFPAILGNAMNRNLRRLYEAAPPALKAVARETTARDFRAKTVVAAGEGPPLAKTDESAEFQYCTIAEAA
jgi:hypothetical protein